MADLRCYPREQTRLLLVLARIEGGRAVYGVLLDPVTHPGTVHGLAGPLAAASQRRFLAGELPADPERAAWGQEQRWAFPVLDMRLAPILGNEMKSNVDDQQALPKTATYRQEYVRCGKETCVRCRAGRGHGPYQCAYWRVNGRLRKRYLGKVPPLLVGEKGGMDSHERDRPDSWVSGDEGSGNEG